VNLTWDDFATGEPRSMTRDELDRELSPSRLVASIDDELARYAALSETAREEARAAGHLREGLRYGDAPDEQIDLFRPAAQAPAPLLIYIHGGFWQMLSRRDSAFAAPGVVAAGGALAVVGYTLAPKATLHEIVEQVRAAVAWLYREAAALGLDRDRFVIAGSSAGAHLAAMALATDWSARALPAQVIRSACLVSGVYDLAAVRESYVNEPLQLSHDHVASLSPLRLKPSHACPTTIVFGDNETDEFKRESRLFVAHLQAHGHNVALQEIARRHHFDVILDLDKSDTLLGHSTLSHMGLAGPSS